MSTLIDSLKDYAVLAFLKARHPIAYKATKQVSFSVYNGGLGYGRDFKRDFVVFTREQYGNNSEPSRKKLKIKVIKLQEEYRKNGRDLEFKNAFYVLRNTLKPLSTEELIRRSEIRINISSAGLRDYTDNSRPQSTTCNIFH